MGSDIAQDMKVGLGLIIKFFKELLFLSVILSAMPC